MDVPHTDFWQQFSPPAPEPPEWVGAYARPMPDSSRLALPLRDLGESAVAGLIANQASFPVVDGLTHWMAERAARFDIDVVLGLPTLGHVVAPRGRPRQRLSAAPRCSRSRTLPACIARPPPARSVLT
jgi:hypothetical protein